MKFIRLFFYFLFLILQLEPNIVLADTGSSQNDQKEIILNIPITIKAENGNLSLEDANGKLINIKNPPFFSIKAETDWKVYLPLFAVIMTCLFSIYLAFMNHKYIKEQKWYDKRSDKLLNLIDKINDLLKGYLTDRANYTPHMTKTEIEKFKIQMLSLCRNNNEINNFLGDLIKVLEKGDSIQNDEILNIFNKIVESIVKEVKNG